jgi:large subunit ribosomal protein L22
MEVVARSKYVRQSPRKIRLVADQVRGMEAEKAVILLKNLNKKAALPILLVLKQGIGNATGNFGLQKGSLKIKDLQINEGPRYKRMDKSHRAFRWGAILKRTAHIRMVLEGKEEKKEAPKVKEVKGRTRLGRGRLGVKRQKSRVKTSSSRVKKTKRK